MLTKLLSGSKYFSLNLSEFSISNDVGVVMFTVSPMNSDIAVAEAPIIWFITSHIALT